MSIGSKTRRMLIRLDGKTIDNEIVKLMIIKAKNRKTWEEDNYKKMFTKNLPKVKGV